MTSLKVSESNIRTLNVSDFLLFDVKKKSQ